MDGESDRECARLITVCILLPICRQCQCGNTKDGKEEENLFSVKRNMAIPKKCQNLQNKKCKHKEYFPAVLHIKIS